MSRLRARIAAGEPAITAAVTATLKAFGGDATGQASGRLDAAIWIARQPTACRHEDLTDAALEHQLEHGIVSAVTTLQDAIQSMESGGRAILIGPIAPSGAVGPLAVAMVEAALISMARSLGAELRRREIPVNVLLPRIGGGEATLDVMLRFLLTAPRSVTGLAVPALIAAGQG
jgi:NAD(P)-dependent dehydrogenase (short-subunit alcohol dehydrogenase family)